MTTISPGLICLLGGGAAIPASGKTHEYLAQHLAQQLPKGQSARISVLETPAGFEPNSDTVAGKLKTFMANRLQNYAPQIDIVPARMRGTPFSPDDPEIAAAMLQADEIALGPGSPTYCARQLSGSVALDYIKARQWQGGVLLLSSSSTLAFGRHTAAIYEIYKVGEDLHWKAGADYFADYGLALSIIPHWNNKDGGYELDTSRCYLGLDRFERLFAQLPPGQTLLGLDDHTSVMLDFVRGMATVVGPSTISILRDGSTTVFSSGETFSIDAFGEWHLPDAGLLSAEVWQAAADGWAQRERDSAEPTPADAVIALADMRMAARAAKKWADADLYRAEIESLGWQVLDEKDGYSLQPINA